MTNSPNFWYLIAFVIFFLLLGRRLWRTATQMLEDKIFHIRSNLEAATQMKQEAVELLQEAQRKQIEAKIQGQKILEHIKYEIDSIQQDSKRELEEFFKNQERQLEERVQGLEVLAYKDFKENIINEAISAAQLAIQQTIDQKQDTQLIQETIQNMEQRATLTARSA